MICQGQFCLRWEIAKTVLCKMGDRQDWWGYLIAVFFLITVIIFVIKILLEFPGLLEWKFVFSGAGEEDSSSDFDIEMNEIIEENKVSRTGPNLRTKVSAEKKTIQTSDGETDTDRSEEPHLQSVADRHALLSNCLSS